MKEAVIVSAVRTAVGKAPKGTLKNTRPDDLGAAAIKEAVSRAGVDASLIEDVILGLRHARGRAGDERGAHAFAARRVCRSRSRPSPSIASARRGCRRLPWRPSASWRAAPRSCWRAGTESMSMIPMGGNKISVEPVAWWTTIRMRIFPWA